MFIDRLPSFQSMIAPKHINALNMMRYEGLKDPEVKLEYRLREALRAV